MKGRIIITLVAALGAMGCANGSDLGSHSAAHTYEPPPVDAGKKHEDAGPPRGVPCRVTGGGQIEAGARPDSFGGNAQWVRGDVRGHWNHVTHDNGHLVGRPDTIECFTVPGDPAYPPAAPANAARFSGTGRYNGEICTFVVYVEDHGEGGGTDERDDYYSIDIECPSGATYSAGDTLLHGNLQIHAVPPGHR
jgi:hypothetical protein